MIILYRGAFSRTPFGREITVGEKYNEAVDIGQINIATISDGLQITNELHIGILTLTYVEVKSVHDEKVIVLDIQDTRVLDKSVSTDSIQIHSPPEINAVDWVEVFDDWLIEFSIQFVFLGLSNNERLTADIPLKITIEDSLESYSVLTASIWEVVSVSEIVTATENLKVLSVPSTRILTRMNSIERLISLDLQNIDFHTIIDANEPLMVEVGVEFYPANRKESLDNLEILLPYLVNFYTDDEIILIRSPYTVELVDYIVKVIYKEIRLLGSYDTNINFNASDSKDIHIMGLSGIDKFLKGGA